MRIKVKYYEEIKPATTFTTDNADGVVNDGGRLYLIYKLDFIQLFHTETECQICTGIDQ